VRDRQQLELQVTRAAFYTLHPPAVTEHAPPVEQQDVPLVAKLLHWIAVALWCLPLMVWLGWLFGWTTIEPAEMHSMVVGSVFFFALGLLLGWIGERARR
jgi:hypothetical protein